MIGGDQNLAAARPLGGDDAADAGVEHLDCPRRRLELAGMADHVAVGVVADDRIVAARFDRGDQLVGDFERAHLGLEIVGRDFRRRHHDAVLARIRGLDAAIEEVGDVSVFLGLRDAQLTQAALGDDRAEAVGDRLRCKGNRQGSELLAVARQGDECAELRDALRA